MAFGAHIHGHLRACGATTIVTNQSSVYVNNQLWAVVGDKNTDVEGPLTNTTGNSIFVENKNVIVDGPDFASAPDNLFHSEFEARTDQGSTDTFCY